MEKVVKEVGELASWSIEKPLDAIHHPVVTLWNNRKAQEREMAEPAFLVVYSPSKVQAREERSQNIKGFSPLGRYGPAAPSLLEEKGSGEGT